MAFDIMLAERALLSLERQLPYLRRHVVEYSQDPTMTHRAQVRAQLQLVKKACLDLAELVTTNCQPAKQVRLVSNE